MDLIALLLLLQVSATPHAQDARSEQERFEDEHRWYGKAIVGLGDVDGDGAADFAVGAPFAQWSGGLGLIWLHSGRTGEVLWQRGGNRFLGWKLFGVGDADGDGVEDLVSEDGLANVVVLSGRSGKPILACGSRGLFDEFGFYLTSLMDGGIDVDDDGVGDLVVRTAPWAPDDPRPCPDQGVVTLSGATGRPIGPKRRLSPVSDAAFGPDADSDGHPDLVVTSMLGAFGEECVELSIQLRATSSEDELWRSSLSGCPDALYRTRLLGDLDQDGVRELGIGSICPTCKHPGSAWILSGADGRAFQEVHESKGSPLFGNCLAATEDLDGDGIGDLLVGEHEGVFRNGSVSSGRVHLVSGATGEIVWSRGESDSASREPWEDFGASVTSIGDVNGDGLPDVAVGAVNDQEAGRGYPGAVHVFSGKDGRLLYSLP